jgi:hypothetical protein
MRPYRFQGMLPIIIFVVMLICGQVTIAAAGGFTLPPRHPDEGENLRTCTACHEIEDETFPFRRYDHNGAFVKRHGSHAAQNEAVCAMCHRRSFCSDCHAVGNELKPSLKTHGTPLRSMPHRGDYLTRHRIDGRINPAECFRCHGSSRNQRSCRSCHG